MAADNFIRFVEAVKLREEEKRVVAVTMRPTITDCTANVYFTDLQLQEGDRLTGYTPRTTTMLAKGGTPARYYNGVVRDGATIVLHVSGETSTALDCYVYPIQAMGGGSIKISQGAGSHACTFTSAANAGDTFALVASKRQCLRNGSATGKHGFFQYTAAYDSKHDVKLADGKSARLYFEFLEMKEGEPRP